MGKVVLIVVGVLIALGLWHVVGNLQAKSNPPAMCQLFGGHWSIWSGWSCGIQAAQAPQQPSQPTTYVPPPPPPPCPSGQVRVWTDCVLPFRKISAICRALVSGEGAFDWGMTLSGLQLTTSVYDCARYDSSGDTTPTHSYSIDAKTGKVTKRF